MHYLLDTHICIYFLKGRYDLTLSTAIMIFECPCIGKESSSDASWSFVNCPINFKPETFPEPVNQHRAGPGYDPV